MKTVSVGDGCINLHRAITSDEQSGGAGGERGGELGPLLYAEAGARESFGVVGEQ